MVKTTTVKIAPKLATGAPDFGTPPQLPDTKEYTTTLCIFVIFERISMDDIDLNITEAICPLPIGVSLAYILVVEYRNLFPNVAVNLQLVRNDGEHIIVIP